LNLGFGVSIRGARFMLELSVASSITAVRILKIEAVTVQGIWPFPTKMGRNCTGAREHKIDK
jgi:hypothetical protein